MISKKPDGTKKKRSRTLKKRAEEIFDFIEKNGNPIPKTWMKELGLGSKSVDNWIELILFIQRQPQIAVTKVGKYSLVHQVFADKYLKMCWKNFLDKEKPHEMRLGYLEDFGRAFFVREKVEM